jgi:hypothetical protein
MTQQRHQLGQNTERSTAVIWGKRLYHCQQFVPVPVVRKLSKIEGGLSMKLDLELIISSMKSKCCNVYLQI